MFACKTDARNESSAKNCTKKYYFCAFLENSGARNWIRAPEFVGLLTGVKNRAATVPFRAHFRARATWQHQSGPARASGRDGLATRGSGGASAGAARWRHVAAV